MKDRRSFIKKAAATAAVPVAGSVIGAPAIAQSKITWRLQTYAGTALAEHVIKPAIDKFNAIARDEMEIELFYADQLVPTGELFQALQRGTIDAVQSDDDSMASPTEVTVFGGYFPFGSRYSLDVPVLFNQYGLNEIWDEEYSKVGVKHISAGAWDPCHFATKDHGIAWSGITEDYTVGWADVTNYFLTNNISGAWIGHFFANMERWEELPPHLQELLRVCMEQSHYYRQWWYWGGEANLRVNGTKMELTTIPDDEWAKVETAAIEFWDEIAAESETKKKVVDIFRQYNEDMNKAGRPYRYG